MNGAYGPGSICQCPRCKKNFYAHDYPLARLLMLDHYYGTLDRKGCVNG